MPMPSSSLKSAFAGRAARRLGSVALAVVVGGASAWAAVPASSALGAQPAQASQPSRPPVPAGSTVSPRPAVPDMAPDALRDANDLRMEFDRLLRQYPPTLRDVLRLDPSLLTDETYLASYPALDGFLRQYPQVGRNARFYVGEVSSTTPRDARTQAVDLWRHATETLSLMLTFILLATALGWLVRTVLDHRRWLRASRVQVEVHQKLFDRLASNDDLMHYIQTPAGQRFLEASPAPTDVSPAARTVSAPINRILWSLQIGIVLVPLGLGLQWVARQVLDEVAQLLWFVGVLAVTTGIGFVASAALAYYLSRRLGLIREVAETDAPRPAPQP